LTVLLGDIWYKYYYAPSPVMPKVVVLNEGEKTWEEFPKPTMRTSEIAQSHGCRHSSSITDIIECYMPEPETAEHLAILYYLGTFCPVNKAEINALTEAKHELLRGTQDGYKFDAVMGVLDLIGDSPNSKGLQNSLGVDASACSWLAKDRKRETLLDLAMQEAVEETGTETWLPWIIRVEREPGSGGEYLQECADQLPHVKRGDQDVKQFRLNEADNIHHFQKWKWVFGDKGCNVSNSFVTIGHPDDNQPVRDAVTEYKKELESRGCSIEEFDDNFIIIDYKDETINMADSRAKVRKAMNAKDTTAMVPYLHHSVLRQLSMWMDMVPYLHPVPETPKSESQEPATTTTWAPTTAPVAEPVAPKSEDLKEEKASREKEASKEESPEQEISTPKNPETASPKAEDEEAVDKEAVAEQDVVKDGWQNRW